VRKYIKIQGEKIVIIANNLKLAHSMRFYYLCTDSRGMLGVYIISFLYKDTKNALSGSCYISDWNNKQLELSQAVCCSYFKMVK